MGMFDRFTKSRSESSEVQDKFEAQQVARGIGMATSVGERILRSTPDLDREAMQVDRNASNLLNNLQTQLSKAVKNGDEKTALRLRRNIEELQKRTGRS